MIDEKRMKKILGNPFIELYYKRIGDLQLCGLSFMEAEAQAKQELLFAASEFK